MNSSGLSRLAMSVGLVIVVLYLVFDIFTAGGNAIARIYMYLMVGAGICGLLSPKNSFYILIFLTAYLDFFKRLMIFDSGVSQMDLYYVLGIAPAMLCGIGANVLYGTLVRNEDSREGLTALSIIVVTLCGALGFFMLATAGDGRARAMGNVVNGVVYIMLLFVVPALFRTPSDIKQMLKTLAVVYIPAIIYLLTHWFRGYFLKINPSIFNWELDYVLSGLTIEIRQLGERVFRSFGTFNAAANASTIFCALAALLVGSFWRKESTSGAAVGRFSFLRAVLVPLLILAALATYSRTGWVLGALAVMGAIVFRNRALTITGYLLGGTAMIGLMLAAPTMLKQKTLNKWTHTLQTIDDSDEWAQATNIATMNDRLEGYVALTKNRKILTPFGLKLSAQSEEAARSSVRRKHDVLTNLMMTVGYVPLGIGGVLLLVLLWRMHRYVYRESDPLARSMSSTCLAIALALCFGGMVNTAQFVTYPVNFWIWFMFGIVVSLMLWRREQDGIAKAAASAQRQTGRRAGALAPPGVRRPVHA